MRKFIVLLTSLLIFVALVTPSFAQDQTIADIVVGDENFSTLLAAVQAADPAVLETLSSEGDYTVMAPTNDAFAATFEKLGLNAEDVLADQALVTQILLYHVAEGAVTAEGALELAPVDVATLEGSDFSVRGSGETVTVNNATVVAADVEASNGIVHVVNEVLMPQSVLQALASAETDLGTADNPLSLMFIPSENAEEVQTGADDLVNLLGEATGLEIEATVSTDYAAAIEAMCNGEAEIGALNTFGYVLASQRDCATVGVVSVRFGSPFYSGQIVASADSGITSLEEITTETVFCRPDPLSTSGWIIPSITMRAAGIDVDGMDIVDSGGHDGVITAVYNGECEAGASFVDARGNIEDENPDVRDVVVVLQESAPIPNDTLSYAAHVPAAMQMLLTEGLLDLANDEENVALLEAVYNWNSLIAAQDAFYDDFREQLDAAGVDIEDLQ